MRIDRESPAAWLARLRAALAPGRARRVAEARARLAEGRLRAVLDAIPEGVVLLDEDGRYQLWNASYAEIYHRSADLFAPDRRLIDVLRVGVARGDYPDAVGREAAWLAEREQQLLETGARHEQHLSDGRWLLIEDRRMPDGGMLGLRVDITDIKEQALALEQAAIAAEAANRAKSEFLANVSHEIRTPLHGILGMTQVLARDPGLDDEQRGRVDLIRRSGQALLELLDDLLDLAKIEAGKLALKEEEFRPAVAVEAACAPFESLARDKGLGFELDLAPLAGTVWRGDSLRIQQVLANLVSNAIKFTQSGKVALSVAVAAGEAAFQVRDTGIGIPADRLAEVFEKFAQVESAKDRRFGGTGLGLAVSRQIAELMGGSLEVESTPGAGSVFTLRLPVAAVAAQPAAAAPPDLPAPAAPLAVRILAAEDNATNQLILRALLEPFGAQLTVVDHGGEAVEAFAAGAFDLVLMDIQMPVVDGVTATRRIRALEAQQGRAPAPIVALSANVMAHQAAEYRAAGMDDVVGKPFDAEQLWAVIAARLAAVAAPEPGAERPASAA